MKIRRIIKVRKQSKTKNAKTKKTIKDKGCKGKEEIGLNINIKEG